MILSAILMGVFSLYAWFQIPEGTQIPIHWNMEGEIDSYGSKTWGLALIPILAINHVWIRGLILGSVVVLLMAGFLMLRTGTGTHTTQEEISSALGGGTPILLEFYSDY